MASLLSLGREAENDWILCNLDAPYSKLNLSIIHFHEILMVSKRELIVVNSATMTMPKKLRNLT